MNTVNENGSKRGVRIHEVKTYDNLNHLVETKKFTYANGIFYDNLRVYNLAEDLYPQYGWPVRYNANYGLLETHIGYGKVTEEVTNTQSNTYKTIYTFDLGEIAYTSQNDANSHERCYCDNRKFAVMEGYLLYSTHLRKWGKLTSIENYDSNNILLGKTCYAYNHSQTCSDTIAVFNCGYGYEISKKLYVYPDVMTQQVTTDYNQGDSLVTTITYSYDNKLRIKRKTIGDSRNILHFTDYTYPDNVPGINVQSSGTSPLAFLVRNCRIGTPVETISGYIDGNNEYITAGAIDIYAHRSYNYNPYSLQYLYKTLSLSLSTPLNKTNYQPMSVSNGQVNYDSHYMLKSEYNFDTLLRPLSIKPFGKSVITFTWNGIYPSTKTIGNQTWTYTYIPHVGISSITDPRGITTYYAYDAYGRLVEEYQINNGNKQVLNAYYYHIKTE